MSNYCIGSCSRCGGDVMAFQGAWMSVLPPPRPTCSQCGATAANGPVIEMNAPVRITTTDGATGTKIVVSGSATKAGGRLVPWLLLVIGFTALVSPVAAQSAGFDIGRYFNRLEDKIESVLDGQREIKEEMREIKREKCR